LCGTVWAAAKMASWWGIFRRKKCCTIDEDRSGPSLTNVNDTGLSSKVVQLEPIIGLGCFVPWPSSSVLGSRFIIADHYL
jgi:hypothetical protein